MDLNQPNEGDKLVGYCECGGATYVGIHPELGCEWSHSAHAPECAYVARVGGDR
ncbi:MAG: hypothetical protein JWR32_3002 [Mycobacterium sp.]|nr:hypothetical protein [Mycobacterium sp.]